jgi:phosphatidyl-myo-inositol dimannoside synthase
VIAPALSPAAARRMRRLAPGVDVQRFRPGCGGAEVRSRLGIPAEAPVLVCVGRMVPRKGQDTLVRAWPRVLQQVPEARLVLVGDGPYRRTVQRLVDSRGVADSVVLTGAVSGEEMPAFIDAGDVFAMPSRSRKRGLEVEALGIVALEAAACGLPVLAGDSGGSPDTVVHGETGYVVRSRSAESVAAYAVALLQDRAKAAAMGKAARERVSTEWTWEATVGELRRMLAG